MIIENPEQFKAWLTSVLEPLCDADPAALAKYVYALVKKDKTLEELRASMVEQLDVFLQHETQTFVEMLFKTLENQEYIVAVVDKEEDGIRTPPTATTAAAAESAVSPQMTQVTQSPQLPQIPQQVSQTPSQPTIESSNTVIPLSAVVETTPLLHVNGSTSTGAVKREVKKSDLEKDDKGEREKRPRSRGRARSRTRSRSRSWERDNRRRSRSREHIRRDRERDRSRQWRNKSPPPNMRRHERRRTRSRSCSPLRSTRIRDISDIRGGGNDHHHIGGGAGNEHRPRFRNRSPTPIRSRSRSLDRNNSSSNSKKLDRLDRVELARLERMQDVIGVSGCLSPGGAGTPTQDSNHGDVDMRLSTTSQSIQSVVSVASRGDSGQASFHTKRRCRDFDEKGYCMRGDLCPYDHGTDPVVLEDVALSRVLTFGPHSGQGPGGGSGNGGTVQTDGPVTGPNGNSSTTHIPLGNLPPPHLRNQQQQQHQGMDVLTEYNPDAPSMEPQVPWGARHGPPQGPPMYGRGQRELISVPVAPHANAPDLALPPPQQQQQSHHHHPHHHSLQPQQQLQQQQQQQQQQGIPLKRKQAFDFNRLGPKHQRQGVGGIGIGSCGGGGGHHNPANCSLELKKVPRSLNNITQLNNHFSKFGKIVNIQVNFGGDPEAALVTFQMPSEAKSAYRSTEAVLNNRFIKVFWHNNVNNNAATAAIENVPPGKQVYFFGHQRQSVKDRLGAAVAASNKIEENEYVPTRRVPEVQQQQQQQVTHLQQQQQQRQKPPQPQPQPQPQPSQSLVPSLPKPPTIQPTVQPQSQPAVTTREDKVLAIKKTQEMLAAKESLKKKQEEKRKEAVKISADLRKRKQELLEKQFAELKVLIEKAQKNPELKEKYMVAIKAVQKVIGDLQKDLALGNNGQSTSGKVQPKTREQAQKEILDAELDLITAQQEGQDSSELQKKVLELKAQAAAIAQPVTAAIRGARGGLTRTIRGATHTFNRGRGRSSTAFVNAHVSVDHRPTNLLISGYEIEEKADVLAHFQQFGEIVEQLVDDVTPSIVLQYKSRKEAELAMSKGRNFQDRVLSITWIATAQHLIRTGAANSSGASSTNLTSSSTPQRTTEQMPAMTDEEIDGENLADMEAILLDEGEEEEDEEGETRSWRR